VLADDAAGEEDALVERFTKARLEARRFYLRSEPLRGKRAPEDIFQARRRRKEEQKSKREKLQDADSAGLVTSLSVTEVVLHSNSTFDMVGGLGENRIRGRWQIMGDDRDQLYVRAGEAEREKTIECNGLRQKRVAQKSHLRQKRGRGETPPNPPSASVSLCTCTHAPSLNCSSVLASLAGTCPSPAGASAAASAAACT
jgi:hypothetical protein